MPDETAIAEERYRRAASRRPFFATPVHRGTGWRYTAAVADTVSMLERMGIRCGEHALWRWAVGNSNLPKARSELAAYFLASKCTDLIFIDADMGWRADAVVRLLASDKAMIGGIGRKKGGESDQMSSWCLRALPGAGGLIVTDDMGAIEVRGVGTGFLKIERLVFEAIIQARPDLKRRGHGSMPREVRDQYYRFFQFQDDADETSEDYGFCDLWRAIGGTVWADPEIELFHTGEHDWQGRLADLLTDGEIPNG